MSDGASRGDNRKGTPGSRAFSAESGRMMATISADGDGFVVFGACTLR
jgi:hypothetical protein